ncbi:MAG: S41 family peptidase [Bacteroidales bacterium]|nr:S41 family peptidase [Bacteroidales bacterium]MCK9498768.1 S41 family peptidase [Bacteroidales bacterium]MDY0314306.1 S41 family peptidase [Bacteroidales bacterium]NLB85909.1 S41 family peptidase [Bacteroidales bacterium]
MKFKIFSIILMFIIVFSACEKIAFDKKAENSNISNFNYLWEQVNQKYAFLEYKNVDWDSIYVAYRPLISNDISEDSLFTVMGKMLNELKDGHVNLISPFNISRYDITMLGPVNINMRLIKENYLLDNYYSTGSFVHNFIRNGDIAYIRYSSFADSQITDYELDFLIEKYKDTKGMIIDIRQNGGGYVTNVPMLLSRFTHEDTKIYETQIKTGVGKDNFSVLEDVIIKSNDKKKYNKNLAVLIDRGSYSASSFFAVSTYAYDNIFLVGDYTGGGLGLPNGGQLANGWPYRFSITRTIAIDGKNYENGVKPDYYIILNPNLNAIDNVIEFAADKLLENNKISKL